MLKKLTLLTIAIGSTALFTPWVKAEPSQDIVDGCVKASNFEDCIRVSKGKKPEDKKMTIDIEKAQTSGNACPSGFAYLGAGKCQQWTCLTGRPNDPRLAGKGWWCQKNIFGGRGGLAFSGKIVDAITAEFLPLEEPQVGVNHSGWNGMTEDELKNGIVRMRRPPHTQINDGTLAKCISGTTEALVTDVIPNSPGDKAGIKRGDLILSIDGVGCPDQFQLTHKLGQTRKLIVKKTNGAEETVIITYEEVTYPEAIAKFNLKTNKPVED